MLERLKKLKQTQDNSLFISSASSGEKKQILLSPQPASNNSNQIKTPEVVEASQESERQRPSDTPSRPLVMQSPSDDKYDFDSAADSPIRSHQRVRSFTMSLNDIISEKSLSATRELVRGFMSRANEQSRMLLTSTLKKKKRVLFEEEAQP